MNNTLHHIAKTTVQPPKGEKFVLYETGMTKDIIKSIINTAEEHYQQTASFAQKFNCGCQKEKTLAKVFAYVKSNIRYKVDATGVQLIKTPSAIIHSGFGDCKAYSILIASILKNLNISFVFRFVSYVPENQDVTHVYIVAFDNNQSYVLDACLSKFNLEKKPYYHKQDFTMTKIIKISGVASPQSITPFEIDPLMNEGELSLLLARQQLELEREIAKRKGVAGIGQIGDYNTEIALINEALSRLSRGENIIPTVAGIGFLKNLFKRKEGGTAVGNFFRKVGNAVKEGAKAVVNVVTFPVRLAVKGILELKLPKASPYFLPIFATDEQSAKLPATFQRERARAKRRAKFITDTIGMKEDHFMKIIRNGIMKHKGHTPETLINAMLTTGLKISGIGNAETQQGTSEGISAVGIIISIIEEIVKLFGKKAPDDVLENGEAMVFETSLPNQPIIDENTGLTSENNLPANSSSSSSGMMLPIIAVVALVLFGKKKR